MKRCTGGLGAAILGSLFFLPPGMAQSAGVPPGVRIEIVQRSEGGDTPSRIRLRMVPGAQLPPHTHDAERKLTVVTGRFDLGIGSSYDRTRTRGMVAGETAVLRAGVAHFGWTAEGAVLELSGRGPWRPQWSETDASPADVPAPLFANIEVEAQADRTATVTTLTRAEIERQNAYTAYDAIEHRPGLHVARQLGLIGSGLSRLTIRGAGGTGPAGLQVFLDGRPDATVSFAHPTPSAMGTENTQRIEVIHGPSPVLYGSGNTGVVNLISDAPPAGVAGYFKQSIREYGTAETQVRVSQGGERGYLRASGSYRTTDGYLPELEADVTNIDLKAGYRLNERWELSAHGSMNEDHFSPFGAFFVPGPFTDPRTSALDLTQTVFDLTLTGRHQRGVTSLKAFTADYRPRSQVLDPGERRADVDESGLRLRHQWSPAARTTLIAGADVLRATAKNSPVLPPFAGPGLTIPRPRVSESLTETGGYLFAEHAFSSQWTASGGIRLIQHSAYGFETAEEAGLMWRPASGRDQSVWNRSAFRARYARGYQSPTLQQLFGVFRGGVNGPANPDLEPERVHQFELGYLYSAPRWDFDLVLFRQDGSDGITAPASPPPPPPDITNSIEFETTGVEARLRARVMESVMLHAGVAFMDLDEVFLRAPDRTFDLGVTVWRSVRQPRDLVLHFAGRHASGILDSPVGTAAIVELEDFTVLDFHSSYRVLSNLELFLALTNLTDEDYELVVGVPAPPFTVGGGITVRF